MSTTSTSTPGVPTTQPACEITGPWNLELHLSGGFAGVERRLELDQSGAYEARDERSGRSAEGLVPADVLDEILGELPSLCSAPPQARPPTCADCFLYLLQGTINGTRIEMVFNDLNLAEHPAGALVGTLAGFLTRALGG
ncbi:MAG TPA: hypothetical protein VLD63_08265 [Anaerolineales bacterium]|nr:hypothetical protein [Anaerolineales bacterium]